MELKSGKNRMVEAEEREMDGVGCCAGHFFLYCW